MTELHGFERTIASEGAEAAARLGYSIAFAQTGLQALTLINGGALVALFTFVGSAAAVKFDLTALCWAFAFFASGLVCNILAYLGAYVAQDCYHVVAQYLAWNAESHALADIGGADRGALHDPLPLHRRGFVAQMAAMLSAVISLGAFIGGCGFALSGVVVR